MDNKPTAKRVFIDEKCVVSAGRLLKTARLRDEYYVAIENPISFIDSLKKTGLRADIFTFAQELDDRVPKHSFHQEWDSKAVLPLTTYENWFDKQINFKPRNKIRKAQKNGVETKMVELDDAMIRAIMEVYNETPIRQGKKNRHYGKDFATVKREHETFLERSEFIGTYYKNEMIGFAKVTHSPGYSVMMNIVAKVSHRDKAPANALIAKTIEACTKRGSRFLMYGIWGRKGLNDFKLANGFDRVEIPRYFVPLSAKGKLALRLKMHRPLKDRVPEKYIAVASNLRAKLNDALHAKRGKTTDQPASEKNAQ